MTWKTTNCAFVFESSEDPSRLILLVAWNSDWHSFAFHFSFFYTQFFGFGFRRRLGVWYTRPISVITRSLRFPYILFSFLHWPDFESEIQTQRGAQYPVNVPWYTKRKKKGKKRLTILLSLPISFASFNFDYDHANANSTFDTWWLSHFQQFNMMHEHILACFDLFWRDLMGYEDGNDLIDLYEWSTKWLLLSRCCCMQVSQRAGDFDFFKLLSLSLQHRFEALWLILDSFHLTFFSFFFLSWLDCSALSIAFFRSYLCTWLNLHPGFYFYFNLSIDTFSSLHIPSSAALLCSPSFYGADYDEGHWWLDWAEIDRVSSVREMTVLVCLLTIAMMATSETTMYTLFPSQQMCHIIELSTRVVIFPVIPAVFYFHVNDPQTCALLVGLV